LFSFHCTLVRYPAPFLLGPQKAAAAAIAGAGGAGDVEPVERAPVSMLLQPPAVKPFIAPGSVLLEPRARQSHDATHRGSQMQAQPSGPITDAQLAAQSAAAKQARLFNTHLLLSVTRYERSSADGARRSVLKSSAVLSAADNVATLLRTLQILLQPHVHPDERLSLLERIDPPSLLLARSVAPLDLVVRWMRVMLGQSPAPRRTRESAQLRPVPLDMTQLESRSIADTLFRAGAPYARFPLMHSAFELQPDGQILQRAQPLKPAVPSLASDSTSFQQQQQQQPSPTLLLSLNGGLPVRSGDKGVAQTVTVLVALAASILFGMGYVLYHASGPVSADQRIDGGSEDGAQHQFEEGDRQSAEAQKDRARTLALATQYQQQQKQHQQQGNSGSGSGPTRTVVVTSSERRPSSSSSSSSSPPPTEPEVRPPPSLFHWVHSMTSRSELPAVPEEPRPQRRSQRQQQPPPPQPPPQSTS
jgi:hypothetical protein